jgi:hypothetical protein
VGHLGEGDSRFGDGGAGAAGVVLERVFQCPDTDGVVGEWGEDSVGLPAVYSGRDLTCVGW